MSRAPRGGIGSNQYQTRPGHGTVDSRSRAAVAAAVTDVDGEAELVAMAFTGGLDEWKQWGATDREIVAWYLAGFTAEESSFWVAYGHTDPTLVQGVDTWKAPLVPRGMGRDQIQQWFGHGAPDLADPARWAAAGWNPDLASRWVGVGFVSPQEVEAFTVHRGGPEGADIGQIQEDWDGQLNDLYATMGAADHNADEAARLVRDARIHGLHEMSDLQDWLGDAVSPPSSIRSPRYSGEQCARLRSAGVARRFAKDVAQYLDPRRELQDYTTGIIVRLWGQGHRDLPAARRAFQADWKTPRSFTTWSHAAASVGMTPDERAAWEEHAPNPDAMIFWWQNGRTPQECALWEPYCQGSPSTRLIALMLMDRGISDPERIPG